MGKVPSLRKISKRLGIHRNTAFKYAKILEEQGKINKRDGIYFPTVEYIRAQRDIPYDKIPVLYGRLKKQHGTIVYFPIMTDKDIAKNFVMIVGEMMKRGLSMEDINCYIAEQN